MSKTRRQSLPVSISQNFLTSRKTIARLLNRTNINQSDMVLEIGAGKGHITAAISCKCGQVVASEIDVKLYESLQSRFRDNQNIRMVYGDFLRSRLPQKEYKVFSNIPFNKTTEIVKKLTQAENPPREAWLVMEKGAAKRFCGKPSETLQSLLLKPFFDVKIVYHFQREDFHPAPRVDVVLLHISRKASPDLSRSEQKRYCYFVTRGLKFGLSGKRGVLTKRQIATALRVAKVSPIQPGGEVLYVQWLCLFRCWLNHCQNKSQTG